MDYRDFIITIYPSGEEHLIVADSPEGERSAVARFALDELNEQTKRVLARAVSASRTASDRHATATHPRPEVDVHEFGTRLFDSLLSGELLAQFRVDQSKAKDAGKGLRLRIRVQDEALVQIPWEYLYDSETGDFLSLSGVPVVRDLRVAQPREPLSIELPLRILGMVASPEDVAPLDTATERRHLAETLENLHGTAVLDWVDGESWEALDRCLAGGTWHVLHFIGHGNASGLVLKGATGQQHVLSTQDLARLLGQQKENLRLVVLNSCAGSEGSGKDIFSSTATFLLRRGIAAVLANQYAITDRAAIEFSRVFYQGIASGLPVDSAVTEARWRLKTALGNTLEWGVPTLYMRSGDGRLFQLQDSDSSPTPRPRPEGSPTNEPETETNAQRHRGRVWLRRSAIAQMAFAALASLATFLIRSDSHHDIVDLLLVAFLGSLLCVVIAGVAVGALGKHLDRSLPVSLGWIVTPIVASLSVGSVGWGWYAADSWHIGGLTNWAWWTAFAFLTIAVVDLRVANVAFAIGSGASSANIQSGTRPAVGSPLRALAFSHSVIGLAAPILERALDLWIAYWAFLLTGLAVGTLGWKVQNKSIVRLGWAATPAAFLLSHGWFSLGSTHISRDVVWLPTVVVAASVLISIRGFPIGGIRRS